MRSSRGFGVAALAAGVFLIGAAPAALAGADDGGTRAFWTDAPTSSAAPTPTGRNERYTAKYLPESGVQSTAPAPVKDPPGYYHAMGTMNVP